MDEFVLMLLRFDGSYFIKYTRRRARDSFSEFQICFHMKYDLAGSSMNRCLYHLFTKL